MSARSTTHCTRLGGDMQMQKRFSCSWSMRSVRIISKHWLATSIDPFLAFALDCSVVCHLFLEFCLKECRCTGWTLLHALSSYLVDVAQKSSDFPLASLQNLCESASRESEILGVAPSKVVGAIFLWLCDYWSKFCKICS